MITKKFKALSGLLALTMVFNLFGVFSTVTFAEEATEVYSFDGSSYATNTLGAYGITAKTGEMWGVQVNTPDPLTMQGVRFSLKNKGPAGEMMKQVFSSSTVESNKPKVDLKDGTYVVEHVFVPLMRGASHCDVNIDGNNGVIAKLRFNGPTSDAKAQSVDAYMADGSGNAIGSNKKNFQITSNDANGKPGSVVYLKTQINTKNKTYSSWVKTGSTVDTSVSDSDLLVSDQTFLSDSNEITGLTYDMQNNTQIAIMWMVSTKITKLPDEAEMTDAEKVAADKELLTIDKLTSDDTDALSTDLTLPSEGTNGSTITWKSSNTEYITDDGEFVKYADNSTTTVTMTATITCGEESDTKTFDFTIAPTPVVVMDESYTTGTADSNGWSEKSGFENNGEMAVDGETGLTIKKTVASGTGSEYSVLADFARHETGDNTKTYTIFADGKASVEFDAYYSFGTGSGAGGAICLDIMGSGGSTSSPGHVSLGRLRILPNGQLSAYTASGLNVTGSSDAVLATGFANAWHHIRLVYNLGNKTFDAYIDNKKANSNPLKATNWSERVSTYLLDGFAVEVGKDLAANSSISVKNVKVLQLSEHSQSTAEKAADTLTSITDTPGSVTEDLTLPASVDSFDGVTVAWSSSNTDIITDAGVVSRPNEDADVTLTATLKDTLGYTVYKEFTVTVKQAETHSTDSILNRAKAYMDDTYKVTSEEYDNITANLTQPLISEWTDTAVTGKKVTITWSSSDTSLIDDDGTFKAGKLKKDTTVTMTATLSLDGKTKTAEYALTIKKHIPTETEIIDADLTNLSQWKLFEKTESADSFDNAKGEVSGSKYVITKTAKESSGYAERYRFMYVFREYFEDDERTATYAEGLKGQYKVTANVKHNVAASGSQQQLQNLAIGSAANSPTYPFPMLINATGVAKYQSGGNISIYSGNDVVGNDTDFIYTFDTETGDYSVKVKDKEYTETVTPNTLWGMVFVLKEQSAANDSMTINSIKVDRLDGEDYVHPLKATADKLTMEDITATPASVTSKLTLPTQITDADGVTVTWSSSDTAVISNDGTVARSGENKDVTLTATITKGDDTIYKEFNLTVPLDENLTTAKILERAKTAMQSHSITDDKDDVKADLKNLISSWTDTVTGKDVAVTWSSSDTSLIGNDGEYKAGEKPNETSTVTMTATLEIDGETETVEYVLIINEYIPTAQERVDADYDSITMTDLTDTPNAVAGDLKKPLPSEGANGSTITWKSSNTDYITDDGTFVELADEADTKVTMTATIEYDGTKKTKDFVLTMAVRNIDPRDIIAQDMDALTIDMLTDEDPGEISESLKTLPSMGSYGSAITWQSSDTAYITDDGTFVKLADDADTKVTMTATFAYKGASDTKDFVFTMAVKPEEPPQETTRTATVTFDGSKTAEGYGWTTETADDGTLISDANGITAKKTSAAGSGADYYAKVELPRYQIAENTYGVSLDGHAAIEFEAVMTPVSGVDNNCSLIDFLGFGGSSSSPSAGISFGRLRMNKSGTFDAINNAAKPSLSSGMDLSKTYTIKADYDLDNKTFDVYIDGEKANTEPLPATNWGVREVTKTLDTLQVGHVKALSPDSAITIKKITTIQYGDRTESDAQKAAAKLTSVTDTPSDVKGNLTLIPTVDGIAVSWTSSDIEVISNDGVMTFPDDDKQVTMTARLADSNGYIVYKEFNLTVKKIGENAPEKILQRAKDYMQSYKLTNEIYADITKNLNTPLISSWTDEASGKTVTISWASSDTTVIANDGTYHAGEKPDKTSNITMTATLAVDGATTQVKYNLTVNKYSDEKLIISANLSDASQWRFFDKTEPVPSFTNISSAASGGKYVMTKTSSNGETDYAERYRSMYLFREYIERYNSETGTATYSQGLQGKYKIVANATHHIQSGSQLQVQNLAIGNTMNASAAYPFILVVNGQKVYNYADQDNPIYNGSVVDKATDFTYTFDTETGDYTVQVGENAEYSYKASPQTLWGIIYVLKNQAKVNDSITVNSIKVYRIGGDNAVNPLSETAAKLTMAAITDTPATVKQSLTLPEEIEGADIKWTSSSTKLIANDGTLGSLPMDGDKEVVLTAEISKDGNTIYKEFHLTVPQEDDPSVILKKDMALVTTDTLTSEEADSISKNLSLPSSGQYGSAITWKSSDTEYISDDGKIVKLGSKTSPEVTMTATFTYGGVSLTKEFKFNVAVDFNEGLITIYETNTTENAISDNMTATNGGGVITASNGVITLDRTARSSADSTSLSVKPMYAGGEILLTREFILDADLTIPDANTKFEIIPKDTEGNRITTIYSGNEGGNKPYFTYVTSDSSGTAQHIKEYYTITSSPVNLNFRFRVNPQNGTFMAQYSLNGGSYKALKYNGSETMPMREAASSLATFEINAPDNTNDKINNSGTVTINNASISTNKSLILKMALDQVDYTAPITSGNGYISDDVNLNVKGFPGITPSWKSSDTSVISDDGVINKAGFTENTEVEMTFTLTLDEDKEVTYSETLPITVVYTDPVNLSNNKAVSSNVTPNKNHDASKAVDGLLTTSWETMRLDENPSITIDLGSNESVSAVKLTEAEILGKYNVKGYKIEGSSDNQKWTALYTGNTLGENTVTAKFSPSVVRYVRYTVTDKEEGNTGLKEIEVLVGTTNQEIAVAANKYLAARIGSLKGITSSVNLPEAEYGCTVEYESSIPEYFSATGVVTRDSTKTVTGTLTIKTTYNGATTIEQIPITIPPSNGSASAGTGGGGGGGGGSAGAEKVYKDNDTSSSKTSSSAGTSIPAFPSSSTFDTSVPAVQTQWVFPDVADDFWAHDYIKALKDHGIVSGDENGNFNPQKTISRQEFVKMLISALGTELSSDIELNFSDVSPSDWSYPYIRKAVEMGIVSGVSDTLFAKENNITREDMAVMCRKALEAISSDLPETNEADFTDKDEISSYAVSSVAVMQNMGIINGYEDGSFGPKNNATRSEAARIIYEFMK